MTGGPRLVLGVLCAALGACDEHPHANAASHASSAALASVPRVDTAAPELRVPAAQSYEVSPLGPGERRPLLIFLHGLGASGALAFDALQLAALGARERAFVIAPDGSVDGAGRRFWNAGPACCNFDHREVDDIARLSALIDDWRARPGIDPSRIYLMGHSNGGFMTERLACALGDRIAAAASISGAAPARDVACPRPKLALLEVRGDADEIVRYQGGTVFDRPELASYPSAQQGFQDWAQRLECTGEATHAAALDLDPRLAGAETSAQEYAHCGRGSLTLWTVHGGNHYAGMGQRAVREIWHFLAAHRQ